MRLIYVDMQHNYVDMHVINFCQNKSHVHIIILHVDINKSHADIIMLHVDINKSHVNIIMLHVACIMSDNGVCKEILPVEKNNF